MKKKPYDYHDSPLFKINDQNKQKTNQRCVVHLGHDVKAVALVAIDEEIRMGAYSAHEIYSQTLWYYLFSALNPLLYSKPINN